MLKRIMKKIIDGMSKGMNYGLTVVVTGGGDGLTLNRML